MLTVILATIYCTVAYVLGFIMFEIWHPTFKPARFVAWLLSPITVTAMILFALAMACS